jgi:hypothetical protein
LQELAFSKRVEQFFGHRHVMAVSFQFGNPTLIVGYPGRTLGHVPLGLSKVL